MIYDPIKDLLGRFFSKSPFLRKSFYLMLDILLLRSWHVHKALRLTLGKQPGDCRIFDAGMGFGQYSWWMARHFKKCTVTAADIKKEQVADCNDFFRSASLTDRVKAVEADLTSYRNPEAFNLILCVDVMEHIPDDTKVFNNFADSLTEKGNLIISTPSDKGGSDVHNKDEESFIGEHVRDGYSVTDITEKLTSAGFSSVKASYTYGTPGSIAWKLTMKYPVMMLSFSKLLFIILPFYYLLVMPFSLILNYSDLIMKHRKGTGLIVIASK